ncbi:Uncharacterized protein M6B38_110740 [Iris pallida]|uniref:DUF4283 domain-containing protein n=1 Tax=Iris pallida TaxID=29817 RepID=A0AAX6DZA7_IRIPA|nr:Uncharacterized protein M6B38_110740 [Iris pallida]
MRPPPPGPPPPPSVFLLVSPPPLPSWAISSAWPVLHLLGYRASIAATSTFASCPPIISGGIPLPPISEPPSSRVSFTEAVRSGSGVTAPVIPHRAIYLHGAARAIAFSKLDERTLVVPFKLALVGKFLQSKLPASKIRAAFDSFEFIGEVQVGMIDFRHVLIRPRLEDDFLCLRSRDLWPVAGCPMRLFRWTP